MSRYSSWLAIAVAAAFLVVASVAFSASTTTWLAFAIAIGTCVVSAGLGYASRRDLPAATIAGLTSVLSAWTIISSLVFSTSTAETLAFAQALGICGLALVGLTVHEVEVEHAVSVGSDRRDTRLSAAA